jgi:hypothetical protein
MHGENIRGPRHIRWLNTQTGHTDAYKAVGMRAAIDSMRRDLTGHAAPWRKARGFWLLSGTAIALAAVITILELRVAVPGWLLPARHLVVNVLHWVQEHWLKAIVITAAAGVAAAAAPFVIRQLDRAGDRPTGARQATERQVMLRRVHYKWIKGVVDASLADAAQLDPGGCSTGSTEIRGYKPGQIRASSGNDP